MVNLLNPFQVRMLLLIVLIHLLLLQNQTIKHTGLLRIKSISTNELKKHIIWPVIILYQLIIQLKVFILLKLTLLYVLI